MIRTVKNMVKVASFEAHYSPINKSYRFDRGYDGLPLNHLTCIEKREGSQHAMIIVKTNSRGRTTVWAYVNVTAHHYVHKLAAEIQNSYDELLGSMDQMRIDKKG